MTSKIVRADGTTELANIKSVTYKESVNADIDLRPGCVASSFIEVTCFGAQSDAPTAGEALTYYQVVGEEETLIGIYYAEPSIPTKNSYSFIAYDAISKLDADFSAWLNANQESFPLTVYQLVSQACTIAGVTLGSSSWPNSTMQVNAFYAEGITCRAILQYAAEIACKFVQCNTDGEIVFDWYTTVSQDTRTASGEIASFDYGADRVPLKSLVAQIDPVQDLNGQDFPYPPGGWKNKFDADTWTGGGQVAWTKNGENNYTFLKNGTGSANRISNRGSFNVSAGQYYISFKASAQSESSISVRLYVNGAYNSGLALSYSGGYYYRALTVPEGTTGIQIYYANNSTGVGTSITVTDVQIEEGSSRTDYAPYENECPITGWDECSAYLSDNAPATYIDGKYYNDSGNLANSDLTRYEEEYIPVAQGITYTFSFDGTATNRLRVHEYDSDKTRLRQIISTPVSTTTISYVPSNDAKYIRLSYPIACGNIELYISKAQVSWQSTAGTVYGGNIVVNEDGSGALTATHKIVDIGAATYTLNTVLTGVDRWLTTYSDAINWGFDYISLPSPSLTSIYGVGSMNSLNTSYAKYRVGQFERSFYYYTPSGLYSSAAEFKAAMSGQQLLYKLATPLTYTFSNLTQLTTLLGTNNIWATTGDVTVEYYYQLGRIYPTTGTFNDKECYAYKQDGLTYDNYDTSALARVAVHPVGEDDVAYYYPADVQSGNTLDITNNALLYGASAADMSGIAQTVYDGITAVGQYRPMNVNMFPNECPFGCGQIVPVTDAQGVSFTTIIMGKTVTDSMTVLTSTGREVYGEYAADTAKKLVQLAADIVRINKLKVDWAEIDQIFARDITVTGQLHSDDYDHTDGEVFANEGMGMDFGEKRFNTPNFGITPEGDMYAQGGMIAGFNIRKGEHENVAPSAPTYTNTGYTYSDGYLEVTQNGTASFNVPLSATVGGVSKPLTRIVYQCYYGHDPILTPTNFSYRIAYLNSSESSIFTQMETLPYASYENTDMRQITSSATYLPQCASLKFDVTLRADAACRVVFQYGNYYALYTESNILGDGASNVYVGDDGISIGENIKATPDGNAKIYTLVLGRPLAIEGGGTGQSDVMSDTTISNIITAGSGFAITNATYKQWGKVAQLYFQASKTEAQTTATSMTVGTVIAGKRPAVLVGAVCTDASITYAYVAAGGAVSARGTWAAGATKTFAATYILA